MKAGREDRGKYQARTAVKQKKVQLLHSIIYLLYIYLAVVVVFIAFYYIEKWRSYTGSHVFLWDMNEQTGGLSNRQKEHKKAMPLAAKRSKVARSRVEKKKKQQRSGKQFRGKKAWK